MRRNLFIDLHIQKVVRSRSGDFIEDRELAKHLQLFARRCYCCETRGRNLNHSLIAGFARGKRQHVAGRGYGETGRLAGSFETQIFCSRDHNEKVSIGSTKV
ncbi:unnamed protein product [Leptidea sinapis]|uniref:Uncharacterized protein n=1 Tax=Leptidea sinapis TaxID=189913 RepID=A0A5E4QBD0_9NEOP|nr:unnamed protein product [Leptidea sinapis]